MSELYTKIDTIQYFDEYPSLARLDYVAMSVISDFEPKNMSLNNACVSLCAKGSATHTVDNVKYKVSANDLWYSNPRQETSLSATKDEQCTLYFLGISNIQFVSNNTTDENYVHLTDDKLHKYIQELYNEAKNPDYNTAKVLQSLFTIIMVELQRTLYASIQPSVRQNHSRVVVDIADYLDKNFLQRSNIDDLCNKFCLSKSSLMHTFKKAYGCSITDYVMQRRLKEALFWLEKSDMQISIIATNAGFSSMPFFYKYFTEKMHMTPTEYRKSKQRQKD